MASDANDQMLRLQPTVIPDQNGGSNIAVGPNIAAKQYDLIFGVPNQRRPFSRLPAEIFLKISQHMTALSLHNLLHAMDKSGNRLWQLLGGEFVKKVHEQGDGPMMMWAVDNLCSSCFVRYRSFADCHVRISSRGLTTLGWIAYLGDSEVLGTLLKSYGYSAVHDQQGIDQETCLMFACQGGYVSMVELLLKYGAPVEPRDRTERSAMLIACMYGHIGIMQLLLDAGATVDGDYGDIWGSCLDTAIDCGHPDAVELLLRNGAKPSSGEHNDATIERAIYHTGDKHSELMELMGPREGPPPTDAATARRNSFTIVCLLCAYGIDLNFVELSRNVIHLAAHYSRADLIKLLRGQNMGILDAVDARERTALHYAADLGNLKTFALLLTQGINWRLRNNLGQTAMDEMPSKLWCQGYKILRPFMRWDEDWWNLVAVYTWFAFYIWVRHQWIEPLCWACKKLFLGFFRYFESLSHNIRAFSFVRPLVSFVNVVRPSVLLGHLINLVNKIYSSFTVFDALTNVSRGVAFSPVGAFITIRDHIRPITRPSILLDRLVKSFKEIGSDDLSFCLLKVINKAQHVWKFFFGGWLILNLLFGLFLHLGGGEVLASMGVQGYHRHRASPGARVVWRGPQDNGFCGKNESH